MRRHLVVGLALAAIGGLGLFVGGCSSGCGHCDDGCYDECDECDECCEEVCHEPCDVVVCEPCGRCLDVWYACPCCEYVSAYQGACVHCGRPLEERHAGAVVSPEGSAGWSAGGSAAAGEWQEEMARAEQGQGRAVAKKQNDCPECAKEAEAARQKARPTRRTVTREKPTPKPIATQKRAKIVDG